MALKLECLNSVVQFGGGAAWLAACHGTMAASFEPGLVTVAGLIGLASLAVNAVRKYGLEDKDVLQSARKKTLAAIETEFCTLAEQLDLKDADRALAEWLPKCALDRNDLVDAAFDVEGFPTKATELVLHRLEEHRPDVFGPAAPAVGSTFARTAIGAALQAAMTTPEYYQALEPDLHVEMARCLKLVLNGQERVEQWQSEYGPQIDSIKDDTTVLLAGQAAIRNELAQLKAAQEATNAYIRQVLESGGSVRARAEGLNELQVRHLLVAFEMEGVAVEQAESQLLKSAEELTGLRARLAKLSNEDEPEIAVKRNLAKEAIDAADFAKADRLLAEAEDADMNAGERRIRRAAETMAERGSLARAQAKFEEAVTHYGRAATAVAPYDAEKAWGWHFAQADILDDHGMLFPGLNGLRQAVAIYRDICLPHTPQETRAADWAMTQNNLGNVLQSLGDRAGGEEGFKALNEAITAYRAALEVRTRQTMPAQWAMTQNNLGTALSSLGERAGGEEGLIAMNEAVAAYRAALQVYTRETMPADWAMAENNLGITLQNLGERADGEEGLKALNAAVAAYRATLEVYTKDAMPADWAMTENNLGIALSSLGGRAGGEEGLKALNEAVMASHAALEVFTRDADPADWAMTTTNLGNALQRLGTYVGGDEGLAALNDAVGAFYAALEIRTRETMPADWAETQNNLGTALQSLGIRVGGEAGQKMFNEAMAAALAALEVRTRETMPAQWAVTTEILAVAESSLGVSTMDPVSVRRAISRMDEVIAVFEAMQAGFYVEKAKRNLDWMRSALAKIERRKSD